MSENQEKLTKSSFVDPKDYEPKKEQEPRQQVTNVIKIGDREVPILKPDIALTLIYGKISEAVSELKMLNSLFSKAAATPQSFQSTATPTAPTPTTIGAPTPVASPTPSTQATPAPTTAPPTAEKSPRIKEILTGLEPVKDLLIIDTDSSAMFVIVRPSGFLGSEKFASVASAIRQLGGTYVSAGRNSHFTITKTPSKQ
jgi:hypothetical protein